jgi:two-component system sensor histidine kinase KdpD
VNNELLDLKRPDPDALLAEVRAEQIKASRGRLKVFFGMSAGVGKTYAMLEEARKKAAEGVDVVVGYAEPHIRPETEAVLVALDILPYKLVEYRNATLKEFDLDAALARKPAICCVDELAHTNAPGMRHPKRWQDVAELLDAGINVYTTLNIQHLESVNDLVERITGVRVRETLPDAIFDAADEVELVDIAPEELLERFREGKVYKPEQAERASRHFFTKGNLIALRELALRKTAERVDEQMQQHRRDERLGRVVPAGERVLVCVGPSPLSARLVRSARRLATSLRGKLIAVSVERQAGPPLSNAARAQLDANLKLAEELGADVVALAGSNVADEVLAYATAHNVTKIVVGKPATPRWRDVLFGSVVDDLIRRSGEIDIYVIRGSDSPDDPAARKVPENRRSSADWIGHGVSAGVVVAMTLIGWPLYHRLGLANTNVLMLYFVGVMWVATQHSRTVAITASLLSVAAFDLIFVPPYYTFAVSDKEYVITFAVMLLTALVISALTHRVRSQAEGARQRERRTASLLGLSRDLAAARTQEEIVKATGQHVGDAVGGRAVLLLASGPQAVSVAHAADVAELDPRELGAAQWAMEHGQPAGHGTNTLPTAAGTYVPLRGPRGVNGVLGVLSSSDSPLNTDRRQMIEAFAAQVALAVERANLADETRAAWERVEAEFLRNTLLSGVSHELRTPLSGITGAATALAEADARLTSDSRRELLSTVIDESARMERLINNLLDMTRMEAGGLTLKREWTPVGEVVGSAVTRLDRRLQGRAVSIDVPRDAPLVWLDPTAIEQVLTNHLDNAAEYTPPGSPIDIYLSVSGPTLRVEVADRGPGIPAGTEKRVFEKFFRARPGDGSPNRGIGLGLAICRAIVEAHGGTIRAANREGGGASFVFTIPTGGTPPHIEYDGRVET